MVTAVVVDSIDAAAKASEKREKLLKERLDERGSQKSEQTISGKKFDTN